jgi:hypothetical protein
LIKYSLDKNGYRNILSIVWENQNQYATY